MIDYLLHVLMLFEIYMILALSLNLVVGYCGLLTLAHASYFTLGAYAYALLTTVGGYGFLGASTAGIVLGLVASLAVSLLSWRLRGDLFVLGTLAVQVIINRALSSWYTAGEPIGSWQNLTNGTNGISRIPRPSIFGWEASSNAEFAIVVTLAAAAVYLLLWRLTASAWGRLLIAMRDDELATRGLSKNTRRAKVEAFGIACAVAAGAGVLYACHARFIDPTSGSLDESILMLSMVIVGGVGNVRGPLIGAAVLVGLAEAIQLAPLTASIAANLRPLLYGLLLVFLMLRRPEGFAGGYRL